jgi:hypothetical protein
MKRTREQRNRPPRRAVGPVVLGMMLAGAVTAIAQPVQIIEQHNGKVFIRSDRTRPGDPDAPARLNKLIDDLGSSDFKVRAQADRSLFDDTGITLPMLERAVKDRGPQLSIDTRLRLTSAARARFSDTPRAAMGIQFWQNGNLRDRVVIERTFPKFDASSKIEDGDMIVEADGVTLTGPSARLKFQSVIVSHDPEDVIPIVVRRGDKKVNLNVRLGRRDDLDNNNFVDPGMLERAWRVRSASYVTPEVDPIKPPVKATEWNVNPLGGMMRLDRVTARQKGVMGLGPSLAGGGMPRGAGADNDTFGQRLTAGNIRRNGQIIINGMVWMNPQFDPMQEPNLPAISPQQELDELMRARAQSASSVDRIRGGKRAAPDGQLVVIQEFVAKDVALIEKQIAAIRAEMTEAGLPIKEPTAETVTQDGSEAKPPPGTP